MTPDLEALVVAAYVFADEYPVPARSGPPAKIADAELVALAVCQAAMGISSDRQFLGLVGYRLPGWFPHLPSQSQYNRRLRGLTGLLTVVQQRLARLLDGGGARLADGTLIGVANYAGCAKRSEFAGTAAYGYCAAKSEYVWGVRLVMRADRRGLPLAYTWVPANEHEYEPLLDLVEAGETVIADKGLWGRAYNQRMSCSEVELLTPARERSAANHAREHALASTRLVIESVFSNLKEQMRLARHLAKTPRGLAQRIAQRLLALTLGIYLNTLNGRPARALAAYDAADTHQASRPVRLDCSAMPSWYDAWADRYEDWSVAGGGGDVPFYAGLAREADGPLVELAVGTGRVAIPIARATGRRVVGIDSSPAMLEQARVRAVEAGVELDLREGDMRELALEEPAALIYCPGRSLLHLPTWADRRRCFERVAASLRPEGRFAWNAFAFDHHVAAAVDGRHADTPLPHTNRYSIGDNRVDITLDDGGTGSLWWATKNEWLGLLDVAGLRLEALHGGFAGEPLDDDSREYVFVARR